MPTEWWHFDAPDSAEYALVERAAVASKRSWTTPIPYYPVNEFGPLMKGLVIGGVGILHVFLAQFAIGGGDAALLLRAARRSAATPDARTFVDGYFKVLVLVSFVVGALTGVAMWFTTIQVGARTIGLMIDEFHWLWATEWVWFAIEIVAGYAFYRFGPRLDGRARLPAARRCTRSPRG